NPPPRASPAARAPGVRMNSLCDSLDRPRRVALQPVVHKQERQLLLPPRPFHQLPQRAPRPRIRLLHALIRLKLLDGLLIAAPRPEQRPADQEIRRERRFTRRLLL